MFLTDYLTIQKATVPIAVEASNRQTAMGGRSLASRSGVSRWQFDITTIPMWETDFLPLSAALNKQGGVFGEFDVRLPFGQSEAANVEATVSEDFSAGSDSVQMLSHDLLPMGTFMRFSGHSKVYQVTASTVNSLSFYPALESSVFENEVITFTPLFRVHLTSNDYESIAVGTGMLAVPYTIRCREVY